MSHTTLVEVCSAVCPWLGLVWCLQRLARVVRQPLRGWSLLVVTGVIAAAVMLVPVQGIVVARWVAGLNAKGAVNLKQMNRNTRKLSERSKLQTKIRSKGEVHVKIGKVTGGQRPKKSV